MAYTTIKKPSSYFNTKLYTQNASTNAITGVNFQPDFTWIKNRDSAGRDHRIFDSVRGANKPLKVNGTNAEVTVTDTLNSFDTDGFTLGADTQGYGVNDLSGNNTVAWNWLASNTTASNTDGSITSTVSANTTSGFSIVKWTGTGSGLSNVTIGHGLGAVPKVVLFKQLDTGNWVVYHQAISKDNYLVLNTTDASASATGVCNPTSTNIVLETSYGGTNSTGGMIAYCFAEKQGFSKFGSYVGNGNADGTFVYTGFKPSFIMIKPTDVVTSWTISDNQRYPNNASSIPTLFPDQSVAEGSYSTVDYLSNGFKLRVTSSTLNGSGNNYIYMAFAEEPLVGDNPATAR